MSAISRSICASAGAPVSASSHGIPPTIDKMRRPRREQTAFSLTGWPHQQVPTSPMTSPRASGPSLITGSPLRAVTPVMSRPTSRPYSNSLPPYRWRRVSSMTTPDARPVPELDCRAPAHSESRAAAGTTGPAVEAPTRAPPRRACSGSLDMRGWPYHEDASRGTDRL